VRANENKPWEQSVHALEGTSAHTLLEVCLRTGADPEDFLGKTLEAGHMPVDHDMADGTGYAIDFVKEYMALNPKSELRIEHPVFPAPLLGLNNAVIWGTPDIQILNYPKELVTIDYKHGSGIVVPVKDNSQIKIYHAGGRQEKGRYRRYRSVVVQPRVPKRKPVQEHTITDEQLVHWLDNTVKPAVELALGDDPPRVAGEWCRYCADDGKCRAQLEQKLVKAKEEFKPDPKRVAPRELAKYLDMIPGIEVAIKGLREYAIQAAHAGKAIPGYEPAFTRSQRVWVDEEKANAAMAKLKIDAKDRFNVTLKSPAQMEDVLVAKKLQERRKRGQPRPASPLDAHIAQTEGNPTIVKVG
jgi:hypothetical protein